MLLIFLENRYELFVWKTEKVLQLLKLLRKVLCEFNRKANKIWVDTGSEFSIDHWNHCYRITN